jgi:opacity protein-like surface antigen
VQPELLYANVDDTSFIQVPLMVKVYPIPKVYIQAGPQFTYILEDVLDDFSKLNTGAAIGAGVDIAFGLFAQARYVFQLNNNYTGPADINLRANSLQAGIGYKF